MIRRFFTRILMMILIGACGYNGWQVHRMQGEVDRLRLQVKSPGRTADAVPTDAAPASWLDKANQHADRARAALARGDFGTAQGELSRGSEDLRRAARGPEVRASAALVQARQTLAALQSQADAWGRRAGALRRAIAPETVNGKSTP